MVYSCRRATYLSWMAVISSYNTSMRFSSATTISFGLLLPLDPFVRHLQSLPTPLDRTWGLHNYMFTTRLNKLVLLVRLWRPPAFIGLLIMYNICTRSRLTFNSTIQAFQLIYCTYYMHRSILQSLIKRHSMFAFDKTMVPIYLA